MSSSFRGAQLVYGHHLGRPDQLWNSPGLQPTWYSGADDFADAAHRLLLADARYDLTEHDHPGSSCSQVCGVELIEHDSPWHVQWLLTATYITAAFAEATPVDALTVPDVADTALARAVAVLGLPVEGPPRWLLTCWDGH